MADFLDVSINAEGAIRGRQAWESSVSAIQSSAARLDSSVAKLRGNIDAFGSGLQRVGAGLTAALTAPLALLAKQSIDSARSFDSLTRGMVAVSGSAERAKKQIAELREVAKLPGLGFKEAIQGSINLQAAGFSADLAKRSLAAFGNALATVGKGKAELDGVNLALSQIASKGKISAEEINQLAERVPQIRKVIEAAFGTSNTEVLQKRNIGATAFVEAIIKELEKLPKVTGGVQNSFENLRDTIEQALLPIGNAILRFLIPAIEAITPAIERAAASFERLSPTTQNLIIIGGAIVAALGPALLLFGAFASAISSIVGVLATFGVSIGSAAALLTGVGEAAAVVAIAATALYAAWETNFGGIREITAEVASFIQERFGAVIAFFQENWPLIKKAAENVLKELKPLFEFYSANIKAVWAGVWEPMKAVVTTWGTFVGGTVRAGLAILAGDFDKARLALEKTSQAMWAGIKNVFAQGVLGVVATTKGLISSLAGLVGLSRSTGNLLGNAIIQGILAGIQTVAPSVFALITRIAGFASSQIAAIKGAAVGATTGSTGGGPSALFERGAAEAANLKLQASSVGVPKISGGGGGGGGSRVKELTDLQKAQQDLLRLEKELANLSDARIVKVRTETDAIKEKIKAAEQFYENQVKLKALAANVPGGDLLPSVLSGDPKLRDAQIETQQRLLGMAEAISKVNGQLLALDVPDALVRDIPNAINAITDALKEQVDEGQDALRFYDQIKNSLQGIIDRGNGLTAAQKALRSISELPGDFDPNKRGELERLAQEARDIEIATAKARERLSEVEQSFRDFGRNAQDILTDAFYRGIVEGPRAFFQALLQGFSQLLAQMAAQLLSSQVFKLLGSLGQGAGSTSGGGFFSKLLGFVGQYVLPIAGGAFGGSFAGAGASGGVTIAGGSGGFSGAFAGAGFASGGTVARSGVYDVGELGRERVFLPQGAYVQNNNDVRKSESRSQVVNVNINVSGVKDVASFRKSRAQIAAEFSSAFAESQRNN